VSITIKTFKKSDRVSLVEAIDAVCAEGRWMSTPHFQPTPAWTHALQEPACPNHLLLVAEVDGRILGWCRLFPTGGCSRHTAEAEIGIGLLPPYRNQGLGTTMMKRALEWASIVRIPKITLTVRTENRRAIHLFEHCGFTPKGYRDSGWSEMTCQPLLPERQGQYYDQPEAARVVAENRQTDRI
jgi:RimJ/RimL family protein N-acetyltransferase